MKRSIHLAVRGKTYGPYSPAELAAIAQTKRLGRDTLFCIEGDARWRQIQELESFLRQAETTAAAIGAESAVPMLLPGAPARSSRGWLIAGAVLVVAVILVAVFHRDISAWSQANAKVELARENLRADSHDRALRLAKESVTLRPDSAASLDVYREAQQAWLKGLEQRMEGKRAPEMLAVVEEARGAGDTLFDEPNRRLLEGVWQGVQNRYVDFLREEKTKADPVDYLGSLIREQEKRKTQLSEATRAQVADLVLDARQEFIWDLQKRQSALPPVDYLRWVKPRMELARRHLDGHSFDRAVMVYRDAQDGWVRHWRGQLRRLPPHESLPALHESLEQNASLLEARYRDDAEALIATAQAEWIEDLRREAKRKPPFEHLAALRQIKPELRQYLPASRRNDLGEIIYAAESSALMATQAAFDTDFVRLANAMRPVEASFGSWFEGAATNEAQAWLAAWQTLSTADTAWNNSDYVTCGLQLARVAEPARKAVYTTLKSRVDRLCAQIAQRGQELAGMAREGRTLEALAFLEELMAFAPLVPELAEQQRQIREQGESNFVVQLIQAILARNEPRAHEAITRLRQLKKIPGEGIEAADFIRPRGFRDFIGKLATVGIHPASPAERSNYLDVVLVANSIDNFPDRREAADFLATTYGAWARQEMKDGYPGMALYLNDLSAEFDPSKRDGDLAARASASARQAYQVQLEIVSGKPPETVKHGLRAQPWGQLREDLVRKLPDWVRLRTEGGPSAVASELIVPVILEGRVAEFRTTSQSKTRKGSQDFAAGTQPKPNPAYERAQYAVVAAEKRLSYAETGAQKASMVGEGIVSAYQNKASSLSSGWGFAANALSGLAKGYGQTGLTEAQAELQKARVVLSNTPPTLDETVNDTFYYDIVTHYLDFTARFELATVDGQGRKLLHELTATHSHVSQEVRGDPGKGVPIVELELPRQADVEKQLAEKLTVQAETLTAELAPLLRRAIRLGLEGAVDQSKISSRRRADAYLAFDYLWMASGLPRAHSLPEDLLRQRFGAIPR